MSKPKLLLISGSLRKASFNRMLLREAASHFDGSAEMADIDLPVYNGDVEKQSGIPDSVTLLAAQIAAADAVLISTPEYNQSLSGVLKNALDWVSRVKGNPWADKPVAIMSAAAGRAGGARAQYALRLAMNPFQPRMLTGPEVMIASPASHFDEQGHLSDEFARELIQKLMTKLAAEIRLKT